MLHLQPFEVDRIRGSHGQRCAGEEDRRRVTWTFFAAFQSLQDNSRDAFMVYTDKR